MDISTLKKQIEQLEQEKFTLYAGIFVGGVALIMVALMWRHARALSSLNRQVRATNHERQETQEVLTKYEMVKQQQAAVDQLLQKDKAFKIVGYVEEVLQQLGLNRYISQELSSSEDVLESNRDYTEVKVFVKLENISTQQLGNLLKELDKTERVYTKDIEITQPKRAATINVSLTVATLRRRAGVGPVE